MAVWADDNFLNTGGRIQSGAMVLVSCGSYPGGSPRRDGAWPTSPILCVAICFCFMTPPSHDRAVLDFCEPICCAASGKARGDAESCSGEATARGPTVRRGELCSLGIVLI